MTMEKRLIDEGRLFKLWDELSEYQLLETEAALEYLLESLCIWLQADDGFWMPAIRPNPYAEGGGLRAGMEDACFRRKMLSIPKPAAPSAGPIDIGMTTEALIQTAGKFRYYRYSDGFLDVKAFEPTEHYRPYDASRGVTDRICVLFPLNEDAESIFCFDRMGGGGLHDSGCRTRSLDPSCDTVVSSETLSQPRHIFGGKSFYSDAKEGSVTAPYGKKRKGNRTADGKISPHDSRACEGHLPGAGSGKQGGTDGPLSREPVILDGLLGA